MTTSTMLRDKLAYDETFSCVKCGYCLPSCPTYLAFGKESHSPRGRIQLVKLAAEGKIGIEDLENPIDYCLGCRACETVCPTNVEYGKILDSAIDVLGEYRKDKQSFSEKAIRTVIFKQALPNKKMLKLVGTGLRLYQKTKADKVVRKSGVINKVSPSLAAMEQITPTIEKPLARNPYHELPKKKKTKLKVAFFTGCIMDTFFSRVNDLSMKLLQKANCEVVFLKEQTCCGALHQHSAEKETAIKLAKHNIEAFEKLECDFIINAIGGCGAALVEYHHLFDPGSTWYERAKTFAEKNKDISYILSRLELPIVNTINRRITYQPSCHLTNVQKVVQEPMRLIEQIPGIEFARMKSQDLCCGSAGIYNIVHHEESMKILDMKMKTVQETKPHLIVTTNPGCHLQMILGVKREGLEGKIDVKHIVELLAEACDVS
ncbi:(Fe-S)-binding protein [Jeotgalibacillus proteolyticus]|uniref:Glycolate oxidase iron-sulfur subunit n=1 Tax=Jeotgalibacillus proteolyticus TaxID=2082395 RepID=A0A2S5GCU9_9BACL|nr:(Fe-S)-binding protein [Jeotgalibacillus proteolyticus]PPA70826.1 glycolate oxidase [Jeotgalibacillus proteolyticus]